MRHKEKSPKSNQLSAIYLNKRKADGIFYEIFENI